jgi:glutamyl-tRNA reductase
VRERVAFLTDEMPRAVERLLAVDGVQEGMILSTCNRTEIVACARDAGTGRGLREFLARERRIDPDLLDRHCYLHAGVEAVRHVFRTAASLDSMILGEAQILGQVKEAYAAAAGAGSLGSLLESLLQRSFTVAKKVRNRTGIARKPVSIAYAATQLARDIFGDLTGRGVLVVGAGEMARLAVRHLAGSGVAAIVVANRSLAHAEELAGELGGRAVPFERRYDAMQDADIVITSTSAAGHVIHLEPAQPQARARRGRPLFFIDIAVPRNVDPRIHELDNVYLYDIDDLQAVVNRNLDARLRECAAAEEIVEHATRDYLAWLNTLEVGPTIVALRRRMRDLGDEEIRRWRAQLGPLSEGQMEALRDMTGSLVNKFLHAPTVALKQAGRDGVGTLRLRLLREIFGLGPEGTESVPDPAAAPPPGDAARPERDAGTEAEAAAEAEPSRAIRTGPQKGR